MENFLEKTKTWVERFVIGLNLCPFAKKPFTQGRIRFILEETTDLEKLAATFVEECLSLHRTTAESIETTLLVHPNILADFYDYLDFVSIAESLLEQLELEGIIQVASFHPDYQFEGTAPNAPENYTNRSPYPMLHLIREESISYALTHWENPEQIPEINIEKMNELGLEGIRKVMKSKSV
jgi:hypothetical protein